MKTIDVPTMPILAHLNEFNSPHEYSYCGLWAHFPEACARGHWCMWFEEGGPSAMDNAFMPDIPKKLRLSKMRSLDKQGLITGCSCGCRGDYEITDKGRALLSGVVISRQTTKIVE